MSTPKIRATIIVFALAGSMLACSWWQGDKAVIIARLNAAVAQMNAHGENGLGSLAAEIIRKAPGTGVGAAAGPSMDAREFTVIMRKIDGEWKVARLTAVDTLK